MTTQQTKAKWSAEVIESNDNLDVIENIFESKDPEQIAQSLKRSADEDQKIKSSPFRVAMSKLTFYINMRSANLGESQKEVLEKAQERLREAYGHPPKSSR